LSSIDDLQASKFGTSGATILTYKPLGLLYKLQLPVMPCLGEERKPETVILDDKRIWVNEHTFRMVLGLAWNTFFWAYFDVLL
jgi:hypothetical protein